MNVPLIVIPHVLRLLLLVSLLAVASAMVGCTTTDESEDMTVYPTPAEKNREMQEGVRDPSRSLM